LSRKKHFSSLNQENLDFWRLNLSIIKKHDPSVKIHIYSMAKQSSIDFAPIQFNQSLLDICFYVGYILIEDS